MDSTLRSQPYQWQDSAETTQTVMVISFSAIPVPTRRPVRRTKCEAPSTLPDIQAFRGRDTSFLFIIFKIYTFY